MELSPALLKEIRDQALLGELEHFGTIRELEPETVLLQEEDAIRAIPLVLEGSLRVQRTDEDGREILLYYILPGESCIMSFLGGMHHNTSKVRAVVEDRARILFLPIDKAGEWVKKYPAWTDFIFRLYHRRFEELLKVVNAVAFDKLDERIWQVLARKAEVSGVRELHMTHQQVADEVGTAREVVSRLLKKMETEGRISLGRNRILLR